jgi:hypothetical protein
VLTDAVKSNGSNTNEKMTSIRANSSLDYSSELQTNLIMPLLPNCNYNDLTLSAQQELMNMNVIRSNFPETVLWENIAVRYFLKNPN